MPVTVCVGSKSKLRQKSKCQEFESCAVLQEVLIHLRHRYGSAPCLRAVRFTRSPKWRAACAVLYSRLRAVWFTKSLNQQWRSSCVFCGLRAARFTRTPKPKSLPAFAHPCLRAVRLTRVLNLYEAKRVLRVAWFTRVLKLRRWLCRFIICLRAVRFTMVLKRHTDVKHWRNGLRAVRFTLGGL